MRGFSNFQPGPGGGGGGGGETPDCGTCLKNAWENVPAWNRAVLIIPTILYLASFLTPAITFMIVCIPVLVTQQLQVWRLVTGIWCHPQLLMLLFALFSYVQHGVREEKRIGTVAFYFRFCLLSTLTLTLFVGFSALTGFGLTTPAAGLWSMLFADLVIESMIDPEQQRPLCCFPVTLKSKYYPWVLIVIFCLFFGLQIDFWCGMAVGYMWHYGLLNCFKIGEAKATAWETSFPFKYWADKPYFVKTEHAGQNREISGAQSQPVGSVLNRNGGGSNFPAPGGGSAAAANSSSAAFKSFSGKGVSLGGGNPAPPSGMVGAILSRNNASESRGRSTPDTRASDSQQRPRNLANESKLVKDRISKEEKAADDLEGHPIEPQDGGQRRSDDKGGDEYVNLTQTTTRSEDD